MCIAKTCNALSLPVILSSIEQQTLERKSYVVVLVSLPGEWAFPIHGIFSFWLSIFPDMPPLHLRRRLDIHGLGITALELLCSVAMPSNGEEAEAQMGQPSLIQNCDDTCRWSTYWSWALQMHR